MDESQPERMNVAWQASERLLRDSLSSESPRCSQRCKIRIYRVMSQKKREIKEGGKTRKYTKYTCKLQVFLFFLKMNLAKNCREVDLKKRKKKPRGLRLSFVHLPG
jgi:hypothetical protein